MPLPVRSSAETSRGEPIKHIVETADNAPIAMRVFAPAEGTAPVAAVAIFANAMGAKQSFYAPLASWLASEGIAAVTFDYRGVGESTSPQGKDATITAWAQLDCAAVLTSVRMRYPDLPIVWIGHSVGAQIFGLVPGHETVRAMLSVAAGSAYWRYNAPPLRYLAPLLWNVGVPLAFAGLNLGGKLGQLIVELPRPVVYQWRSWCMDPKYLGGEEALHKTVAQSTVPITALSFSDDELMTLKGTEALFGLYERSVVEVKRFAPRDFGLKRIGHFGFFREAMEPTLWRWMRTWIKERTGGNQDHFGVNVTP